MKGSTIFAAVAIMATGAVSGAELAVEFAVPASVPGTEEAQCIIAPNFETSVQRADIQEGIRTLLDADGTVTLLRSSTHQILERRGAGIDGLWEESGELATASCVSRCIRLPAGTRVSRLRFTDEDGLNECLRKPMNMGRMPSISDLSCGNTVWRDIVLTDGAGSEQMLCATAVAWLTLPQDPKKRVAPATQNRLVVEYDLARER